MKLAKGSLNNIFQDSFNKILSQQLTHDRSYISSIAFKGKMIRCFEFLDNINFLHLGHSHPLKENATKFLLNALL